MTAFMRQWYTWVVSIGTVWQSLKYLLFGPLENNFVASVLVCYYHLFPTYKWGNSRRRTLILPSMDMSIWPSAHQLRKIWRFSWETWLYILTQLSNPCGALGRRMPAFQSPIAKNKAQTHISIEQPNICIFISPASQVIMGKTVAEFYMSLDCSQICQWERSPGEGNSSPLQYSCLGNSMDRGAWWAAVQGVTEESDMT